MKVVILAGGHGTRLSEETIVKPKPMVEIGGRPILWHIMKLYSNYGFNEFIICLGYKGDIIKDYFVNYLERNSDLIVNTSDGKIDKIDSQTPNWKVWLIDTGKETMTGGRLRRVVKYIDGDTFMMAYGDGVSNVDINKLLLFHKNHKKLVTVTAVQPEGRFGALNLTEAGNVNRVMEKPLGDGGWVNSGFFVINKKALKLIHGDDIIWEREPMESLATNGNLMAYRHFGFWKPMDTLSDKNELEKLWSSDSPPWKVWK